MQSNIKDFFFLHFLVLILGFTAILGKLITVDPISLVLYRTAIASITILVLLFIQKKNVLVSQKTFFQLSIVGILLALHWICFFGSARMATVSVSLVSFSTTSFFTSIIEPLSKKQPISKKELLLGLMVVAGILLIFNFESQYYAGILVGLLGAFLAALYSTANAHLAPKLDSKIINLYQLGTAALFMILLAVWLFFQFPIHFKPATPSYSDWGYLIVLGIACTVYPYIKLVDLMKKFTAFTITLSVNMEPIYGIILALVFFGETEKMSLGFYAGAAIILSTIILHARWDYKEKALLRQQKGF